MPWKIPPPPARVSKADITRITRAVKKEFPGDWALQQVHIWRGMLTREAELMRMDFGDYITYLAKADRDAHRKAIGIGNGL
jgi:hypothetical protein